MKGILAAFFAILCSVETHAQLPSMKPGTLKINDLVKNYAALKQGGMPYDPVKQDNNLDNPIFPRRVNMKLDSKFSQSYFYDLKIINALGYKDDRYVSLYFLVPGNEGLIQMINQDLGMSPLRTVVNSTSNPAYKWTFNGYTVTVSPNSNLFNEAEPAPFYYEVRIRAAGPQDENPETNVTE